MKKPSFIREFKLDKATYDQLSVDEKKVIPILTSAAKILADIYLNQQQNSDKHPGASLYPNDISDEDLEEASRVNPEIFSPYTVVENTKRGIVATPYHVKYKNSLQKISQLLKQASQVSRDKKFVSYLKSASLSLINGDYEKMDIAWLDTSDSNLQFLVGPYERYLDKRFAIKMAYLSFIGVKDVYYTEKAERMQEVLFTTVSDQPHRIPLPSQIHVSSIRTTVSTGFIAHALFSTEHIPSDDRTIQKHGARLIGYLSNMDYKFDKILYPIFEQIFEKTFKSSYSKDLLRKANYYLVFVYGLSRLLHRYEGSRERLKDLLPLVEEVNSIVSGNQHCKHLVMKGVIDQKELEAIIVMHICWLFSEWVLLRKNNIREAYFKGDIVTLNFLMGVGALQEKNGISWPNFAKMFFEMENLAITLAHLYQQGTYAEAQAFFSRYLSLEPFKAFDKRLAKIKPI